MAQDEGLNPRDFRLKYMFFSGEPGASIPGVRDKIEELYGAKVFDSGSMAKASPEVLDRAAALGLASPEVLERFRARS